MFSVGCCNTKIKAVVAVRLTKRHRCLQKEEMQPIPEKNVGGGGGRKRKKREIIIIIKKHLSSVCQYFIYIFIFIYLCKLDLSKI